MDARPIGVRVLPDSSDQDNAESSSSSGDEDGRTSYARAKLQGKRPAMEEPAKKKQKPGRATGIPNEPVVIRGDNPRRRRQAVFQSSSEDDAPPLLGVARAPGSPTRGDPTSAPPAKTTPATEAGGVDEPGAAGPNTMLEPVTLPVHEQMGATDVALDAARVDEVPGSTAAMAPEVGKSPSSAPGHGSASRTRPFRGLSRESQL